MVSEVSRLEDLIEFYKKWPDLRHLVTQMLDGSTLKQDEKNILRSMMHVVDCVGPDDFRRGSNNQS